MDLKLWKECIYRCTGVEQPEGRTTQVVTAGLHDRLKCTWNFTVIPEVTLDSVKVEDYDALAIPGGFEEAGFITMDTTPGSPRSFRNFMRRASGLPRSALRSYAWQSRRAEDESHDV